MVHTHVLTVAGALVTKRYSSWARGEHRREWEALRRVHRHAPQLAPRPVEQHLDADPPWITMSRVPGEPLPDRPTPVQLTALAHAVGTLWTVPHDDLSAGDGWIDDLACARRLTDGPRPDAGILAQAFEAAVAWWDGPDPALLRTRPAATVLGHRDPNLANYLWDGERVRIVDFEDAAVSDPATELAIMLEHLALREVDVEALTGHFDVDPLRLLAARRLWAMFWLRLLLPGGPSATRNPAGTAERQAERLLDLLGVDRIDPRPGRRR